MSQAGRRWWALVALGVVALGAWKLGSCVAGDEDAEAASLAINRPWIERKPSSHRDLVRHVTMIDHPRGRVGVTGRSSAWKHDVELFRWALEGDRLLMYFPQTG